MSVSQVWMVYRKKCGQYQQLLLALADTADDDGGSLYPSLQYLAWKTEKGLAAVRRQIRTLVERGILEIIEEPTPRRSTLYALHLDRLSDKIYWRGAKMAPQRDHNDPPALPKEHPRDAKMASDPMNKPVNGTNYLLGFDEFWKIFPKHRDKRKAEDQWKRKKLTNKKDIILTDIKIRLKKDPRWLKGFIPDPHRYLRDERWNDDLS